jgi:hypothetical protein
MYETADCTIPLKTPACCGDTVSGGAMSSNVANSFFVFLGKKSISKEAKKKEQKGFGKSSLPMFILHDLTTGDFFKSFVATATRQT